MKKFVLGVLLAMLALVCAAAAPSNPAPKDDRSEVMNRLSDSARVLDELMNVPESNIPDTVVAKARCVAVIPSMVKGDGGQVPCHHVAESRHSTGDCQMQRYAGNC